MIDSKCCGTSNQIEAGSLVHSTRVWNDSVRLGGSERYIVKYISEYHVVIEARRLSDGSFVCESSYSRKEFDKAYELCPGTL